MAPFVLNVTSLDSMVRANDVIITKIILKGIILVQFKTLKIDFYQFINLKNQ